MRNSTSLDRPALLSQLRKSSTGNLDTPASLRIALHRAFLVAFAVAATSSCINDPGVAGADPAGKVCVSASSGWVMVDDFETGSSTLKPCDNSDQCWTNMDAIAGLADSGLDCTHVGNPMPNLLHGCPTIFPDSNGPNKGHLGRIRADYVQNPVNPYAGPVLRISFDISSGIGGADSFVCLDEPLDGRSGNLLAPLDLTQLGAKSVSFWLMAEQQDTNMQVSLKDSNGIETAPKPTVGDQIGLVSPNTWTKVKLDISPQLLVTDNGVQVNNGSLKELVFCFDHDIFLNVDASAALEGVVYVDDIAFEP